MLATITHRLPRLVAIALTAFPCTLAAQGPAQQNPAKPNPSNPEPWRLNNAIGSPSYLKFSGSERIRFEGLNGQFRNSGTRNLEDQVFSRTILRADYSRDQWGATLEGIDARAWGTQDDSFANTTTVNTFDVLEANVIYKPADGHKVTVGRYTMDIGSRRLSARNKFRNTINSFNGVRWDFQGDDGYSAGAFWNMPTERRPGMRSQLVDNEHDFDNQSIDYQFFGLHSTQKLSLIHI